MTSSGREGVDALLAASAFCENINVIFLDAGVSQLLVDQQPSVIKSKDYAPMFKLFELYEIEHIYVCQASLARLGLGDAQLMIDARRAEPKEIAELLHHSKKVLTF